MAQSQFEKTYLGSFQHYTTSEMLGVGEYLPEIVDETGRTVHSVTVKELYAQQQNLFPAQSSGCTVDTRSAEFEAGSRQYDVICVNAAEVTLPLNYSKLHRAWLVTKNGKRPLSLYRTPQDGHIRFRVPSGRSRIEIIFPRFTSLIFR